VEGSTCLQDALTSDTAASITTQRKYCPNNPRLLSSSNQHKFPLSKFF